MEIKKATLVVLGPDEKAVALRELNNLVNTIMEVRSELKKDELTEDMKDTLLSLTESYTSEVSKVLTKQSRIPPPLSIA